MKQLPSLTHFVEGVCRKGGIRRPSRPPKNMQHLGPETELATYHAMQKKTEALRIIESKAFA
jgi:hypothetical protein